jgi:LCP family protein required for cell wall assembly
MPTVRRHVWRWIVAVLLVALVSGIGVAGWVLSRAQHAIDSSMEGQGGSAADLFVPKALDNEDAGRVNILLAGNSFDDEGHEGAALTDSIMVASMDMTTGHITLISIPRDLWVEYSGHQMKINAVFPYAASGTQGAETLGNWRQGMNALGGVVQKITGLHIDQYALVGYTALKDTVDAVGGIDVVIATDDPRGLYDANVDLLLAAGPAHLDGTDTLKLARARNHPMPGKKPYGINSDWGRAENQRMILAALLAKVRTTPALANPAAIVGIFDSIAANVRTDLTVSQIRRVFDLASKSGPIASVSIKGDDKTVLLVDYTTDAGADTVVPAAGRFAYYDIQRYIAAACAE